MLTTAARAVVIASFLLLCPRCAAQPRPPGARPATTLTISEKVFDGDFGEDWQDIGWAPREKGPNGTYRINFSDKGGWIVRHLDLRGKFGGFTFRVRAPISYGDFLELRVDSGQAELFPRVVVSPANRRELGDNWSEVWIPIEELNPRGKPFDRIVFRAHQRVGGDWIELTKVGFTSIDPKRAKALEDFANQQAKENPSTRATMTIDCRSPQTPISPLIYGIANSREDAQFALGATARRWGGNTTTRYNWELGNVWNTAADWYFMNVKRGGDDHWSYTNFLEENSSHAMATALTVPMIGWVSKDSTSYSFSVSKLGAQQDVNPDNPDIGNGMISDDKKLPSPPPTTTSVAASPDFVARWVATIHQKDTKAGSRSIEHYILDNEPMLWHDTHRDIHPDPVSYDELLRRTIAYGTAVRKADPHGKIAGPAEWGWVSYFHSAVDHVAGLSKSPDRKAHGDMPLIPWYLQQLKQHEQKTGVKLIDIVDVHYYPQGKGMGLQNRGKTDPATAALRIRSTRSLWDPTYKDESWIDEEVRLIPRLKEWIDKYYPGLGISIGEYNFGAEKHMSGGLAQAETLGRFGQYGIQSAYFWTVPPAQSPAFWAFRAYRNYDGKGARFLDYALPTRAPEGTSLFASRDVDKTKLVAVLLNFNPDQSTVAQVNLTSCGSASAPRVFVYKGDPTGFQVAPAGKVEIDQIQQELPPYSMTVLEWNLKAPTTPQ